MWCVLHPKETHDTKPHHSTLQIILLVKKWQFLLSLHIYNNILLSLCRPYEFESQFVENSSPCFIIQLCDGRSLKRIGWNLSCRRINEKQSWARNEKTENMLSRNLRSWMDSSETKKNLGEKEISFYTEQFLQTSNCRKVPHAAAIRSGCTSKKLITRLVCLVAWTDVPPNIT